MDFIDKTGPAVRQELTICETTKRIRVRYSAPVANCTRRLLVLPPPRRGTQSILIEHWDCWPKPDNKSESQDEFGNRVIEVRHALIQKEFVFDLALRSERENSTACADENIPLTGLGAFVLPSALCDLAAGVDLIAREEFDKGQILKDDKSATAALGLATRICDFCYSALRYKPGTTGTGTTASQVLTRGEGVCQDYAHLMIALCRACAIPARYVSGYNPAEGGMHAWVEALCGDTWHAFDPTHARVTRPDCVFVATGRDFRDVSPVSGKYNGQAKAKLDVHCRTRVVEN